jgi:hypothetical protein
MTPTIRAAQLAEKDRLLAVLKVTRPYQPTTVREVMQVTGELLCRHIEAMNAYLDAPPEGPHTPLLGPDSWGPLAEAGYDPEDGA